MIQLPIEIGDVIRVGRFKNKRVTVKEISWDEYGLPMVNGKGILKIRIEKLMPVKKENKMITEGPAQNNPKIQKIVDELNKIIESAKDSDGDPIGVVDTSSSWEEPCVYQPIQYKNGSLKIISQSQYKHKPEVEIISKKDMEFEGIPTLKNILKMYRKAMKESGKTTNENTMKRNIKEFRESGTKVTVKKEDNEFWLYLLTADGVDECISEIGYKTEELANHAAFMKGFEVVNSKGTKEKIGFDELPDTRLPPKGTKAEPVKHEEPKYIDLGSESKIKLENLIRRVIKEETLRISRQKKTINEVDVTNTDLEADLIELSSLSDEMDRVKAQLKELENRFKPLDDKFRQILEAMDDTQDNFLRIKNLLITIKRKGYDRVDYKYKEAYLSLRNKVNAKMKKQMDDFLEFGETVSGDKIKNITKVKSSLGVQRIESNLKEENFLSSGWAKLKNFFARGLQIFNKRNQEISNDIDKLEKLIGK